MAPQNQSIIIKKIKKGGHGHHGGAWKVAYADFVTAMMAFFLLMWLLTATPVENLQGLADYFSPTLGLQGKMGIGFSGGQAPNTEGVSLGDWASQGLIFGAPPSGPIIQFPEQDNKVDEQNERVNFSRMEEEITKAVQQNQELQQFKDSILIEQTPEGLRIQITDQDKRPMFRDSTAELMPHTKKILAKMAEIINSIPNYIEITGHTGTHALDKPKEDYSIWELSAERANAARRYLIKAKVDPDQVTRVVGKADQDLINKENQDAPENSRVSIILLRKSFQAYHKQPAPDEILLGPMQEDGLESYVKSKKGKKERDDKKKSGGSEGKGEETSGHGASEEGAAAEGGDAPAAPAAAAEGQGEAAQPATPAPAEPAAPAAH